MPEIETITTTRFRRRRSSEIAAPAAAPVSCFKRRRQPSSDLPPVTLRKPGVLGSALVDAILNLPQQNPFAFLGCPFCGRPPLKAKKPGRPRVALDAATGKLAGAGEKTVQVIEHWESGKDLECIRAALHSRTRSRSTKISEIRNIKRILRKHKALLTRLFDHK